VIYVRKEQNSPYVHKSHYNTKKIVPCSEQLCTPSAYAIYMLFNTIPVHICPQSPKKPKQTCNLKWRAKQNWKIWVGQKKSERLVSAQCQVSYTKQSHHAVNVCELARHILYISYSKRGKYSFSKVCTFFDEKLGFMYVRSKIALTYINPSFSSKNVQTLLQRYLPRLL
jgi:hypothetical protein